METRTLSYVAESCAGELRGDPSAVISRVCTDSRSVQPGDLFIALPGERFDGHSFLVEVSAKGVRASLVEREKLEKVTGLSGPMALVVTSNTRKALGQLAARYRQDFEMPFIAVAGSNGKTSTKEIIATLLRQKFQVLWSEASFNNDIGVPMTLMRAEASHQVAVLEAGTNHPGELEPLLRMIQPKFGVLTSIDREHLEFFNDLQGVAEEEGFVGELLPAHGKLFANGDAPELARIIARTRAAITRVGRGRENDWRLSQVRTEESGVSFWLDSPDADFSGRYSTPLLGAHQALNSSLAIAVAREFGLGRSEIENGLNACKPAKMRLQLSTCGGVKLLDDAYNANADSMRAALRTLTELPAAGRRIAVLGPMAELGVHGVAAHLEVGVAAAQFGVDRLVTIGEGAAGIARGARQAGLAEVAEFPDWAAAATALREEIRAGDAVLVKASRSARLERLTEALRARFEGREAGACSTT